MDIIHYYGQTRKEAVEKAISEYGKDIYILNEAPKNLANGFVGVSIIPNEDTLDDAYQEIDKTNTTDSKSSLSTLRKLALNYEFEYSNRQKRPNRRSKSDIEQASSNFQFAETGDEQINEHLASHTGHYCPFSPNCRLREFLQPVPNSKRLPAPGSLQHGQCGPQHDNSQIS